MNGNEVSTLNILSPPLLSQLLNPYKNKKLENKYEHRQQTRN